MDTYLATTESPEQRTANQDRQVYQMGQCEGYMDDDEIRRDREFRRCSRQAQLAVLTAVCQEDMTRDQAATVLQQTQGWAYSKNYWAWWLLKQSV